MATLEQFVKNMARRGKQVEDGVERAVQKTFIAIGATIVPATPVDTGRARGGWLSGKSVAPSGEGALDPGGQGAISSATAVGISLRVEDVGVIVNNVPYITKLNRGTSRQAPAGFVEKAVQAATRTVRSTKILVDESFTKK